LEPCFLYRIYEVYEPFFIFYSTNNRVVQFIYTDRVGVVEAPNTHLSTHIVYVEQQQLHAMRCTTVLQWKLEVKRQLHETVAVADQDCAADGESVAADIEALNYHRRDAITFRAHLLGRKGSVTIITVIHIEIEVVYHLGVM